MLAPCRVPWVRGLSCSVRLSADNHLGRFADRRIAIPGRLPYRRFDRWIVEYGESDDRSPAYLRRRICDKFKQYRQGRFISNSAEGSDRRLPTRTIGIAHG